MSDENKDNSFVVNFSGTEIRIIQFLLSGPLAVNEICSRLNVTPRMIEDTRTKAISALGGILAWY